MAKSNNFQKTASVNLGYQHDGGEFKIEVKPKPPGKDYAVQNGGEKTPKVEIEMEDPWKVTSLKMDYIQWDDLSTSSKVKRVIGYFVKVILVLGFLYLFICSLDFLSSAFKLLGGKKAGEVFQQSDILSNPVAGLMMGVLVTVLVQSSSTSTSIIISMVGADILTIETSIPIIMGANIGTSVTNTIVALGQITDKGDFRRAFAGATVHDMFNWLTVIILLPIEVLTGYLNKLSSALVQSLNLKETLSVDQELLKTITQPFTKLIIEVSSSGIEKIATGANPKDLTLMKLCCDAVKPATCCDNKLSEWKEGNNSTDYSNSDKKGFCAKVSSCVMKEYISETQPMQDCLNTPWHFKNTTEEVVIKTLNCSALGGKTSETDCCFGKLTSSSFYTERKNVSSLNQQAFCASIGSCYSSNNSAISSCNNPSSWTWSEVNHTTVGETFSCKKWTTEVETDCLQECRYLFKGLYGKISDEAVGGILLVLSLVLLCFCLVAIVKLLHSLLQGPMAKAIKTFVNADFPGYCSYFTGYLALLLGAGFTILVQSSSIFTSTLTPLVGIGVIELERMYPLTLGSNIGTTMTGILSALAQDAESIPRSLQVAFCHLFFNISGILIFYPLPFFRPPIPLAKFLGNTTAKYRWFSIVYILAMFFILPAAIFALSVPGWYVLAAVLIPIVIVCIVVSVIKCIQAKRPQCLPSVLQSWKFLPEPLRSLAPYDKLMRKLCFCNRFSKEQEGEKPCIEKSNECTPL